MPLRIHVHCEEEGCEESAPIPMRDGFDVSATVVRLPEKDSDRTRDPWHFFSEIGWTLGPDGWLLDPKDRILCPDHVPQPKGDPDAKDV